MRRLLCAALFLSPVLFAPACDQPSRICDLICECEHCNDLAEDYGCEQVSASKDIAEIYECLNEWTAYADCFEDKGTCDEREASFSTRELGSCSATASSGLSCADDSDCQTVGIDGARCEGMVCVYTACAGDQVGQPCSSDSECPGGVDKCEEQLGNYGTCIAEASENPNFVLGFGFGFN